MRIAELSLASMKCIASPAGTLNSFPKYFDSSNCSSEGFTLNIKLSGMMLKSSANLTAP